MQQSIRIIGILNVTPDSYHDGGQCTSTENALERAEEMLSQGADIIEVGGESTGPGSATVPLQEELRRAIPVLSAISRRFPTATLAIDTWKSEVARRAIEAGVTMVNDVTAGRSDPAMFSTLAETSAKIVLMYSKDSSPRTTIADEQYDDIVATAATFLGQRKQAALEAGIAEGRIILDPGMGHFVSSDPRYSFELLARLHQLKEQLGSPMLVSPSRKSFLAGALNLPASDRLSGTIAASAIAVLHGADFVRTHDVLEVRRAVEVAAAIRSVRDS